MAAKKNPLSDRAYELYKSGVKLVDIAAQLGLPDGTIRRWKSTYRWDGERSECKSERSVKKRTVNDGTKETLQNEELTPEQQMFCIYYIRTFNAAQSYQKAYGCQYTTAVSHGYMMLSKVAVRKEIERLKEIKRQQIVASEEDIIELQMRIAFADMGDYMRFRGGDVVLNDSSTTDTQLIKKVSSSAEGVSIALADSQKAIDWLTKYFLMHPDDKYKAEFDRKRAEFDDNSGEQILQNIQTITDILQHPVPNRNIENLEAGEHEHTGAFESETV